jgi:hypothetical protein
MTDIAADENAIREFLLRRVPRLLELRGEDRLEQFRSVCGAAVRCVAKGSIRPGTCVNTLMQVAEQRDVPGTAAKRAIRQSLGEAGRPPGRPALPQELRAALRAAPSPVKLQASDADLATVACSIVPSSHSASTVHWSPPRCITATMLHYLPPGSANATRGWPRSAGRIPG